jgi:phage-related holin
MDKTKREARMLDKIGTVAGDHLDAWLGNAAMGAGLYLSSVWMRIPLTIHTLVIFMGTDVLTGAWSSKLQGKFSNRQLAKGIQQKCLSLILLWAVDMAEPQLHANFHIDEYFAWVLFVYEFRSIMGNVIDSGALPKPIEQALNVISDRLAAAADAVFSGIGKFSPKPTADPEPSTTAKQNDPGV